MKKISLIGRGQIDKLIKLLPCLRHFLNNQSKILNRATAAISIIAKNTYSSSPNQAFKLICEKSGYNLIELVWHSAKEYIAHREFETKDELEKVVDRLLNEGELIINWSRKLKNKGNAV